MKVETFPLRPARAIWFNTRMSTKQRKPAPARRPQKALKISAKARYALRILKDIADHQDGGEPTTEAAIARRQGVSAKFLSRIVLPLRDAKFVSVRRGSRDGFALLVKPEKITLLDIVETVQGPVEILDCLDASIDCGRKRNCFARRIWTKANAAIRKSLAAITLADA